MWYLEEFAASLRSNGLTERTIANYRRFTQRMIGYFMEHSIDHCRKVSEEDVQRYLDACVQPQKCTPGWKYVNAIYIHRYFQFLADENIIFAPPRVVTKNPGTWSKSYPAIEEDELRRILNQFPADCDSDILAKAILETAYSSALRSSEIRRLKLGDISYASGTLFVEQSKGGKDRVVPVGSTALYWIKRYIKEVRPRYLTGPDDTHVFIGIRTGKPFRHRAPAEFIKARLYKHGLPHLNIHQLRASAATHMVNAGMKIGYAQHMLGHQELNTTKTYVQIHQKELDHLLAKHHPRAAMETQISGEER